MSDTDLAVNVKRLFASQSISVKVEKVYNEANIHGQTKSLNSFTKIQESLYSPRKIITKAKRNDSTTNTHATASSASTRRTLPAIVVTDSGQTVMTPNLAPLSNAPIPPGLEAFIETDHLFVTNPTDNMDMPINASFSTKYDVFNSNGDRIYYAHQIPKSAKCCATLFGYPYTFVLLDAAKTEVLRYEGDPATCGTAASVQIQNKNERFGEVSRVKSTPSETEFVIGDGKGSPLFVIKQIGKTGTDFEVYAVHGEVLIGRISNKWGNNLKGKLASDYFGISFTKALDVRMKALLLGALIMLDFHFFDKKK